MATTLLRLPEVKRRVGLKRSAIYHRIKEGKFPKPVSLSDTNAGVVAWKEIEIEDWISSRTVSTHESPHERTKRARAGKADPAKPWSAPGSTAQ